jgi:hypothetical protein
MAVAIWAVPLGMYSCGWRESFFRQHGRRCVETGSGELKDLRSHRRQMEEIPAHGEFWLSPEVLQTGCCGAWSEDANWPDCSASFDYAPYGRSVQGNVTNCPRKSRAESVSIRYVTSVARQFTSPVTVMDAMTSVSPMKCGPPESP